MMYKSRNHKRTKVSQVLEYLQEHGSITSWEAIDLFGATRLSAIIFNLRKHHVIDSETQSVTDKLGYTTTFTKYVYCGEI